LKLTEDDFQLHDLGYAKALQISYDDKNPHDIIKQILDDQEKAECYDIVKTENDVVWKAFHKLGEENKRIRELNDRTAESLRDIGDMNNKFIREIKQLEEEKQDWNRLMVQHSEFIIYLKQRLDRTQTHLFETHHCNCEVI